MGNSESSSIATFNGQGGLEGFVKFEPYNQDGYKSLVTIFLSLVKIYVPLLKT